MFRRVNCLAALVAVTACTSMGAGASLVAWYEFENNVLDSSGNGYNGTEAGGPVYDVGKYGQAIHLDAIDDTVTWTGMPTPAAITVSLWVKLPPTSTDANAWLLDHINVNGPSWKGWQFKIRKDTGTVSWILADANFVRRTTSGSLATLYDGNWHHIAGTHDGATTAALYLDGVRVGLTTGYGFTPPPAAQAMVLNRLNQTKINSGDVDDLSIWNGAMNATEVMGVFNDGMSVTPGDQDVTVLEGYATLPSTLQSYTVANGDISSSHTVDIAEADANGDPADYAWLSLSASQFVLSSASSGTVTPTIDHLTSALTPGVHTAYIKFTDQAAPATPQTRRIRVTVIGCQWTVAPGSVHRYYLDGSGDPPVGPVVYTISNTGKHGLTYSVQEVVDQPWLTLDKSGSAAPMDYLTNDNVTATIDKTGLAVGDYTGTIRFTNNCNPADTVDYTVALHILPSDFTIVAPGLLAHYKFEETAKDWSGNGWHGTTTGGPVYTGGSDGRAIQFHGVASTDGVDLGDIPAPNKGVSKEMSVALWFRADGEEGESSWLVNKITAGGATGWEGWQMKVDHEWFGLDWEVSTLEFRWCHDGLRDSLNTSAPNKNIAIPGLYDGNWHQIVMTIEDAAAGTVNVRGYYDGAIIEGQNIWSQTPDIIRLERLGTPFTPADNSVNVWLSGDVDRVLGGVDELSFWDRALTPAEIEYMYLNGFFDTRLWADSDEDGDVDMDDFALFQRCSTFGGGGITDPQTCQRFDRDFDSDIDEMDLNKFRNCATGTNVLFDKAHPPVGCNN